MRLRRRHAWSAALIVFFVLPVLRPDGFPAIEDRVDSFLGWTGRASAGNPHSWSAIEASASDSNDTRRRDLEQIVVAEREEHFRVLDEVAQTRELLEAMGAVGSAPRPRLAIPAQILRAHDASATRRSLLIDRGGDDGLEVGLAVTQGRVLVGVIAHVDAHSARVQLLTDPHFRLEIAVRTADGVRQTAFVPGGADDELSLKNLRGAEGLHVRPGDPVLTSNANEMVPAGLLVGTVTRASDDDADAILAVRLRPAMNLSRSTTVLVIQPGP